MLHSCRPMTAPCAGRATCKANIPPCSTEELLSAGATRPRGSSSVNVRSAQTGQWSLPSHSGQMSAPVSLSSTVSCSREGHTSVAEAVHCQPDQLVQHSRHQQMAVASRRHAHTAVCWLHGQSAPVCSVCSLVACSTPVQACMKPSNAGRFSGRCLLTQARYLHLPTL